MVFQNRTCVSNIVSSKLNKVDCLHFNNVNSSCIYTLLDGNHLSSAYLAEVELRNKIFMLK